MRTLRDAAQQALKAMEREAEYYLQEHSEYNEVLLPAMNVLRAALAEDALQKFTDVSQEIRAALAEPVPDSKHATIAEWWVDKQRKALTEEEILRIKPVSPDLVDFRSGVRCAERAHGIKDA